MPTPILGSTNKLYPPSVEVEDLEASGAGPIAIVAWAEKGGRTLLVLLAAGAFSGPLGLSGGALAVPFQARPVDAEAVDDGLLVTEAPMILQRSRSGSGKQSIEIKTDPCGALQRFGSAPSMRRQSDEDENDAEVSDMAQQLVQRWFSQRSDIAVINDGVAKSCDGIEGQDFGPEFEAHRVDAKTPLGSRLAAPPLA